MDTNQLLESQCESLVKEVALIISQKWPQVNDSGRLLLQKLFDKFTEIFSRSEPDTDAQSEKPDIKDKIHNLISHSDLISNFLILTYENPIFNQLVVLSSAF